jgi:hypothetical protein
VPAPPPASIYAELKGWQTAIGSVLGFLALMVAALWNFRLNRRRDARLREEEVISVAAALYGEIVLLRKEMAGLARAVANVEVHEGRNGATKFDAHFLERHKLPEPLLYKVLASKIGLLSSDLILASTEFHQNFQEARTGLPLLIENPERQYGYSRSTVLMPARDAVKNIVPALRKIERMAHVAKPAEELDLWWTEDVIWQEEELFKTPTVDGAEAGEGAAGDETGGEGTKAGT